MRALTKEPEVITRGGKPVSVILPIKQYQEMLERLEDVEDIAWLKKARSAQSVCPSMIHGIPATRSEFDLA